MTRFDPETWSLLEPLLDELLDLEPAARAARLELLARERPEIHPQIVGLLAAAESGEADSPLRRSAGEIGALLFANDSPQPSRLGERVGAFEITGELGRGGMGTVYAARRVGGGFEQEVAIKIVKGGFDSEEVLRRFLAERRILARLEHPHIARLVDGGLTLDGLPWFALERIDGRPITAAVEAKKLPVRERLTLFLAVCDAVTFAHRQRIVHRDIKPSNVLVDGRGQVKLLDFGIAKLLEPGGEGMTRTEQAPMTPQYAAPEQLAGGEVTEATDVWQLGRLFALLLEKPLPRDLERIAARAAHEEPARRYAQVEDLAEDVRRFLDGRAVEARGDSPAYRLSRFARRRRLPLAAAAFALAAAAIGVAVGVRSGSQSDARPTRFELLSTFPGSHRQASFSPDGGAIAFLTEDAQGLPQVFVKSLAEGAPRQLTFGSSGAHRPRWSPRGDQIVYDVPGLGIWSVPPAGGAERRLLAEGFNPNLSPDGSQLVYEVATGLWTATSDGREARRLGGTPSATIEKEYAFIESTPAFSADGSEVVYFQDRAEPEIGDLWSLPLAGGVPRRLTRDEVITRHPAWLPDGSGVVYSSARRGGLNLWFLPADGGEPRPLTTGAGEDTEASVSADGRRIVYTTARNLLRISWLDPRTGERRHLLERRGALTHPAFSPDGRRLVVFQREGQNLHLWDLAADGADRRQLTRGDGSDVLPEWSQDGRWIYYYRLHPEPRSFRRLPAGGGASQELIGGWHFPVQHGAHVSPDQREVVYTELDHGVPVATRVRDLVSGAERELATPILWPRWSPDGTMVAGRTRSLELALCPPGGAACRGLGYDGTEPRWSRDGREIYFVRYSGYHGSRDPRFIPLWKTRLDGSGVEHVADLPGASPVHFFYDVGPNGEVAWCEFVAGRQELWLAELQ